MCHAKNNPMRDERRDDRKIQWRINKVVGEKLDSKDCLK